MVENATKTAVEFPCTSDDACLDNSPVVYGGIELWILLNVRIEWKIALQLIATDAIAWCVFGTQGELCKTAEPIEMQTHVTGQWTKY